MTKHEFLTELRSRLAGLPKEDLDNRIIFYEEMINDIIDEGKTEEEAVAEIGTVDEVVEQIAKETPLLKLVKEKAKQKRSLRAWEIVLIILGFPLWFPLLLVAFILCLVAYLLIWILVLVTYSVELGLVGGSIYGLLAFMFSVFAGEINFMSLGLSIMCLGGACLFVFACIGATKLTIKLSAKILTKIKSSFMKKGAK